MNITKLTLLFVVVFFNLKVQSQSVSKVYVKTPLVKGETVAIKSEILKEERVLNIYLPPEYDKDTQKTYPVIYVLDGGIDEDFLHISGIVQFGSFSWINMIPESIVVGIANVDRKRDFTFPTNNEKDKIDFPTTGKSANFIEFLESELKPFINSNYKTNAQNTIIGQSLGGLLVTEILFRKPELFDNYTIVSPSLWWNDQSLLKLQPSAYSSKKSIYIAVGKEGEIMEKDAKALHAKLNIQITEHTNLYFEFFEKLSHGDSLHLAVYDAFSKFSKE